MNLKFFHRCVNTNTANLKELQICSIIGLLVSNSPNYFLICIKAVVLA